MIRTFTKKSVLTRFANLKSLMLFLLFAGVMSSGFAATFVVDNTTNNDDLNGYTAADGTNTLKKCIRLANANAGADVINFAAALGSPVTITLSGPGINQITDELLIDGTSAVGYTPGNPVVEIDGNQQNYSILDWSTAGASNSVLKAVVVRNSANWGLFIGNNASNVQIKGCFIGTNLTGTAASANTYSGIEINNANNAVIGGTTLADRNIISGNLQVGIKISGSATGNKIIGNYIGTDISGAVALSNGESGVASISTNGNTIGGTAADEGNLISGNTQRGLFVFNSTTTTIKGNILGLNASGNAAIPNLWAGVELFGSSNCIIGGANALERNIISGNGQNGILLNSTSTSNTVQGNYIGTDITGAIDLGNIDNGVWIAANSNSNTIGKSNVISGNNQNGILIMSGSTGNTVNGNYIGTNAAGLLALGNAFNGIEINGAGSNTIGGPAAGDRNIIGDNTRRGIYLIDADNNLIRNNYIGVDVTGNAPLGNGKEFGSQTNHGIHLDTGCDNTTILDNVISANGFASGTLPSPYQNGGPENWMGTGDGIFLTGSPGTIIKGNNIGVGADGTTKLGNQENGIAMYNASNNAIIGGSLQAERNVISNHKFHGIINYQCENFDIKGNFIGTDATGTMDMGNQDAGIITIQVASGTIGGTGANDGNTVVFAKDPSDGYGIRLQQTANVIVKGNFVGTNSTGTAQMGNSRNGIWSQNYGGFSNNSNVIGASATIPVAGEANTVAYNGMNGVAVENNGGDVRFNSIRGNKIYCNADKGIALIGGTNEGIAKPFITTSNTTTIGGTALPNSVVHVYRNNITGSGCGCEGEIYLGTADADPLGNWTLNYGVALTAAQVPTVTITQTNGTLSTSEFRAQNQIITQPVNDTVCVGSNAEFAVVAAGNNLSYQWKVNVGAGWINVPVAAGVSGINDDTLKITNTIIGMNDLQLRVEITGCDTTIISNTAVLKINTATSITTSPVSAALCAGTDTSFNVVASGSNLTYQWQENTGGGFVNINDGGIYSGAGSSKLKLTGVTAGMNSYQYHVIVNGSCGSPTSAAATLTVNTAPSVTTSPLSATICAGTDTSFSVVATGTNLSYQWQESTGGVFANISDGGIYGGTETAKLTLTGVTSGMNTYKYKVIVNGTCTPPAISAVAIITVNTAPSITTSPISATICNGTDTTFSVLATGANLSYQWQESTGGAFANINDGGVYSGSGTSKLKLTGATAAMSSYQYKVIVSGSCAPPEISSAVLLTVNTAPGIITPPASAIICSGTDTSFSVSAAGTGLSYQWQESTGGAFTDINDGGVYSGSETPKLTLTGVTAGMNSNQYRVIVSGTCTPAVPSLAATLTVNTAPNITTNPVTTIVCPAADTVFKVAATGTGLTYQWQEDSGSGFANINDGGIYDGTQTATLKLQGVTVGMNSYQYKVIVSGVCGAPAPSSAATLTVNSEPTITTSPIATAACEGVDTVFNVVAAGTGLTYQWKMNSGSGFTDIIGEKSSTLKLTGITTSMDNYQYKVEVSAACGSPITSAPVVLTVNTAPAITIPPIATTVCEGIDTVFKVSATGTGLTYQWQVNTGAGFNDMFGRTTSTLNLSGINSSMNNNQFQVVVTGTCGSETSTSVALTVNTKPSITTQPLSTTACEGVDTTLKVVATGTGLSYQWQVDNGSGFVDIGNSDNDTLKFNGVTPGTKHYMVKIDGTCGSVTSSSVDLTVLEKTVITDSPDSLIVCEGGNALFNVSAKGFGFTPQWQVNTGSGFVDLTTGASFQINGVAANMNNNLYRVVLNGTCGSAISDTALLTVNTAPVITTDIIATTVCEGADTVFKVSATGTALTYQWQVDSGSGYVDIANNDKPSLSLTNIAASMNNNQYQLKVSGTCGNPSISGPVALTVNTKPSITGAPIATTVCEGADTVFKVAATGTDLKYKWQVNSGSGFVDANNGTDAKLILSGITANMSGYQYQVNVSGACGSLAPTTPVSLTVNTKPSIANAPIATIVCEGADTAFKVTASGTNLNYQWKVNSGSGFVDIANSNSPKLSLSAITAGMTNNQYQVVVSGTCGTLPPTTPILLTVNTAPNIITSPLATTICEDLDTMLKVVATGTGLSYQWQVNSGSSFVNANNGLTDTLVLAGVTANMNNNQYQVIVTGVCGSPIVLGPVLLTVNTAPTIISAPIDSSICEGMNTSFSVGASGSGVKYQWQENTGSGFNNINDAGVFGGAITPKLSLTKPTPSMSTFRYRVVVSGICSANIPTNGVELIVSPQTVAGTLSKDLNVCPGNNTVGLKLNGKVGDINYWEASVDNGLTFKKISQTEDSLTFVNIDSTTQYRVIVKSGVCAAQISNSATISITPTKQIVIGNDTSICSGSFMIHATPGFVKYLWQDGDTLDKYLVIKPGVYSVVATDANGCKSLGKINVAECDTVYWPNVITPNGDDKNQYFKIIGNRPGSTLQIYNRWGLLLKTFPDYKNDWDASDVTDGTYYFIYHRAGEDKTRTGFVEVIK